MSTLHQHFAVYNSNGPGTPNIEWYKSVCVSAYTEHAEVISVPHFTYAGLAYPGGGGVVVKEVGAAICMDVHLAVSNEAVMLGVDAHNVLVGGGGGHIEGRAAAV